MRNPEVGAEDATDNLAAGSGKSPLRVIDFLSAAFEVRAGFERRDGRFIAEEPWALVSFGTQTLAAGWWALECEGDAAGTEVRLSSADDPLIVFNAQRASLRIHLAAIAEYDVSVLASPWPGARSFRKLGLRRLDLAEQVGVLAEATMRLLSRDRPIERIRRVLGRIASGQPIGVGLSSAASVAAPARAVVSETRAFARAAVREEGGLSLHLLEGDEVHPQAFEMARNMFVAQSGLRAIYADALEGGTIRPKPGWDAELAEHADLAGHPVFFRSRFAGSAANELRRLTEQEIGRIALPLVRRSHPEALRIAPTPAPNLPRSPRVSVLIPTKYRVDLLANCLAGLAEQTDYPDLEVIIIDNGCTDPQMPSLVSAASARLEIKHIVDARPFNYPQLNDTGAKHATGEILLLLNDDIEPIEPTWISRMVDSVMQPEVGAVGARLLYPDRTIQHAGVMLGLGGVCGHLWKGVTKDKAALIPQIVAPGTRMAVTAACMAVRREIYQSVGGLDQSLAVALNDIDFCLRLRARGLKTIYRGDAELLHHESQSRGADDLTVAKRRRLSAETAIFFSRWKCLLDNDPFGSPAYDPAMQSGAVRRSLLEAWPD